VVKLYFHLSLLKIILVVNGVLIVFCGEKDSISRPTWGGSEEEVRYGNHDLVVKPCRVKQKYKMKLPGHHHQGGGRHARASREGNIVLIVPLNPACKAWQRGTCRSMLQEESCGDRRARIARGLSNYHGDHKKLVEKVFNLVISSGEILINLTPDR
jgi:hypothetical protein